MRERRVSFYLFLAPWMAGFLAFRIFPMLWCLAASLTNRTLFTAIPRFVGLSNYLELLRDPLVRQGFLATFAFAFPASLLSVVGGLVLALLLTRPFPGRRILRTLFYVPCLIPEVAVGWVFRSLLEGDTGLLNLLLGRLGLASGGVPWLAAYPRGCLLGVSFWQAGWCMLVFLGGLSTVPEELEEAARIDGAGFLMRLRRVTLPLLTPFVLFLAVTTLIAAMQVFLLPFVLSPYPTGPGESVFYRGTPRQTSFAVVQALFLAVTANRFAYGLALMWLVFVTIAALTLLLLGGARFWVYSETDQPGA